MVLPNIEEEVTIFENKAGLSDDLRFLASMPELCDVTFLVGENKEPVCGVKAVLASRSKVLYQMFYYNHPTTPMTVKKEPKDKFLALMKRRSESSLGLLNTAGSSGEIGFPTAHLTIVIDEFEPDVMRQLVEYSHTGCVTLQPRTLLGVMSAADKYCMEELKRACYGFAQGCINVDTVCALLQSADRYVQYKCTKAFLQQVLEFVDRRGNDILNLGSFALLPVHIVRLILSRKELIAEEFTKFQAALMWTMKYNDLNKSVQWKVVFRENFLDVIKYHKIPATVLMKEIDPLKVIPNEIIMAALAHQADPNCVKPEELVKGLNIRGSQSNLSEQGMDTGYSPTSSLNTSCDTVETLPHDDVMKK